MDQKLQVKIHLALSACSEAYNLASTVEAENAHFKESIRQLDKYVLEQRRRIGGLETALREILAYVDHEAAGTEEIVCAVRKRYELISKICQEATQ